MLKILKYILVLGLPAVVCAFIWMLGVALYAIVTGQNNISNLASAENWPSILHVFGTCFLSAFVLGCAFHSVWLKSKWPRLLGWAALHEICGATLFGTFIFPVVGTIYGAILAFPLMPVQILGSIAQILLFRHLHTRFLAPKAP